MSATARARRPRFAWRQYRLLLRYARPHRGGWAAILVLTVLTTAVALLVPLPLKVVIDNVIGHQPVGPILGSLPGAHDKQVLLAWAASAEFVFFALAVTLDVVLTMLWIRVGQRMVYDLARDLFARVQRQSLLAHSRAPVGETMARVAADSWCVHTVVDELLLTPLHVTITVAGLVFVMSRLSVSLTLLALAVAPLMALAAVALGRPMRTAADRRREIQGEIQSHVQQTLAGIHVVKAFGQEERHRQRFDDLATAAIRSHIRVALAGGFNGLGSGLVAALGTGAILIVGAHSVMAGALTVGALVVFIPYLQTLNEQLQGFAGIHVKLQEARAGVDRVTALLDAPSEVHDDPAAVALAAVRGDLRLERVSFAYGPGRPVLQDVSLTAVAGRRIGIVGATGAGKSTLIGLVPRFFDPDSGRVLLDGHDLRALRLSTVRGAVSVVLQESFLFPISIAENIAYGVPGATRGQIVAAAKAANAHDFIISLRYSYDTPVGERGATLSGGERQRVAIARALLKDAPILILDEPTAALDAETEASLLEALDRLMAGRTTLTIAHRLSTVRSSDEILVLDQGRVIERGRHESLLARDGAYARLWATQTGAPRAASAGAR
jgi:ATP-binding cassette subfamily B protein/subfamily B ATP-binding cassette protein MsbA